MAVALRRQLDARPKELENWVLLGRTSAALQRWPDAEDAFDHAIALRPDEPALHAQLGEVLTLKAGGQVGAGAKAEFQKAADDPRSIFYLAVARAQQGDVEEAKARLRRLADAAPPEADWRQMVLDTLRSLDAGQRGDVAAQSEAIDAVENELARLGPPSEPPSGGIARQAIAQTGLRLGELEDHVRHDPRNVAAWLVLVRAYQAAGDAPNALNALARANRSVPGNVDLLLAYADALADGITAEGLPAPLVGVMRQINAIDPNQPDALWYLGLAAAQRGDSHRARNFWQRLAGQLPAGSGERKSLQERLDALP
jgi:cytochrome c-type biogenesis protein CcmH